MLVCSLLLDLIPESTFSNSLAIFFLFLFFNFLVLVLDALPFAFGHVCIYPFMHSSLFFIHVYLSLLVNIGRFFFFIFCVYLCMGVCPSRAGSVAGVASVVDAADRPL